ncbi:MAG TPA: protease inhibitor I9 family protein, partial [Longimicrobium sp.]|nr:protease inhibitor I9 family protein [Longimicrobium sp.]
MAPPAGHSTATAGEMIPGRFIVVFSSDVSDAPGLSRQLTSLHGGKLHHSYQHVLKGFAATLPPSAVEALRKDPRVAYVDPDRIVVPTT